MMMSSARRTESLVREIAKRSVGSVLQRMRADTRAMDAAELRGYIRARAVAPVRQHARRVSLERRWRQLPQEYLITAALERTVQLVARELSEPVGLSSLNQVMLRSAA